VLVDLAVVILNKLKPSPLSHIQLFLGEEILQARMICVDLTLLTVQVMFPNLKGKNDGRQFEIVSQVVWLVAKFLWHIHYYLVALHNHTPQSFLRGVTVDCKVFDLHR
jgi:hypothetical protein